MYLNRSVVDEPNHLRSFTPAIFPRPTHQFWGPYTLPSMSTWGSQFPPIGTQTQTTVTYGYNSADNSGLLNPNKFGRQTSDTSPPPRHPSSPPTQFHPSQQSEIGVFEGSKNL